MSGKAKPASTTPARTLSTSARVTRTSAGEVLTSKAYVDGPVRSGMSGWSETAHLDYLTTVLLGSAHRWVRFLRFVQRPAEKAGHLMKERSDHAHR